MSQGPITTSVQLPTVRVVQSIKQLHGDPEKREEKPKSGHHERKEDQVELSQNVEPAEEKATEESDPEKSEPTTGSSVDILVR